MTVKEDLHRLIDQLPEDRLEYAKEWLEDLQANGEEEVLTAEEWAEIEEGREEIRRGEFVTLEEYERKRGL